MFLPFTFYEIKYLRLDTVCYKEVNASVFLYLTSYLLEDVYHYFGGLYYRILSLPSPYYILPCTS